jgi:hypothetical protein
MRKLLLCVPFIIGTFSLAHGQTAPKTKFLPIVFDDWWNVDYVKNGCELGSQNGRPCPSDRTPKDVVREFENELEVVFASETACHGLSLVHFTPEMAQAAVKNPNAPATGTMAKMAGPSWSLILDLSGHSRSQTGQGWTLVDSKQHAFNGRITTPERVIQRVCKIVKGVGGQTEK